MKERFFPEDYRAFCCGPLSLCMDRFGGIEECSLIDILHFGNAFFPERYPLKLFSRSGLMRFSEAVSKRCDRPYIYPAIRFLRESDIGFMDPPAPEYPEILPSGVRSERYECVLSHYAFSVQLKAKEGGTFIAALGKAHFFEQTSLPAKGYNHLAHEDAWLPPEFRGDEFRADEPFPDSEVKLFRAVSGFDKNENKFFLSIRMKSQIFDKNLWIAFTSSEEVQFSEDANQWVLRTIRRDLKSATFSCGIGFSRAEASSEAEKAVLEHARRLTIHSAPNRFPNAPLVHVSKIPEAEEFMRVLPYYQHALILAETDRSAAIRAAFHKYGFFALWDHVYPLRDFLICGEPEIAEKGLRFLAEYPHLDTTPFMYMHLTVALNEYLAFKPDSELGRELFPVLTKAFRFCRTLVNPETGLIRYGIDTAVDVIPELGLDHLFYASCVNGWWYDSCRTFENLALEAGEETLADDAAELVRKMDKSYVETFFDPTTGFLRAAVGEHGKRMTPEIYLHTKTLALDYIHGFHLFRNLVPSLAEYLEKKLIHPLGLTAVAWNSEAPAVYLKGTRMNHHIGHTCKTLRLADNMPFVRHILNGYFELFRKYQCAIETFNYAYCAGNQTQNADWQAFSATAAAQGVIQGGAGLAWHRGGLFHIPAGDSGRTEVKNFHFSGKIFDFLCEGRGKFIGKLLLNGTEVPGTAQIPADLMEKAEKHSTLRIVRSNREPVHPVLLYALDMPVRKMKVRGETLSLQCGKTLHASFALAVPEKTPFRILRNGAEIPSEASGRRVFFDGRFAEGDLITAEPR